MRLFKKNLTLNLLLIFSFVCINSCNELYETPETVYLIKKGAHKSNIKGGFIGNGVRSLKSETLAFTARFDESAIYDLGGSDQGDINKLFGFSDCNSLHHDNSARFGWAYNLDSKQVDIYAYVYNNGERKMMKMGSTVIHETNHYRLSVSDTHFEFEFGSSVERFERGSSCNAGLYYLLFPYFGGNQTAPHDIQLVIQELH